MYVYIQELHVSVVTIYCNMNCTCWLFDITMDSQVSRSNDGDGKLFDIAGKTTGNCWETMGK